MNHPTNPPQMRKIRNGSEGYLAEEPPANLHRHACYADLNYVVIKHLLGDVTRT